MPQKKNVKICRLGCFNHSIDFQKIEKWSSKYFKVSGTQTRADIDVNHFEDDYVYPTQMISDDMGEIEPGCDLLIGVVDQPLEDNFYMHRIGENRAVLSIFPVLKYLRNENIPVENYIIRCIYEMIAFLYENGGNINDLVHLIPHHETRGCLFDMNVFIDRIVYSTDKPIICSECQARLRKRPIPEGFIEGIQKEIRRIRKPLFYRIEKLVKRNPIQAFIIASLFATVLNIAASAIYDYLK
jgi:hypothetical protein